MNIQARLLILLSISVLLSGIAPINTLAQDIDETYLSRVDSYKTLNPRELLFIHTDREVYSPGEVVSFKAYIRNEYDHQATSESRNLHLLLVDRLGDTRQEKIFQIKNNSSAGEYDLFFDLEEGEYSLIGWTDGMEKGSVENVFTKKLFLKNKLLPGLVIRLSPGKSRYLPGDITIVSVELKSSSGKALKRKKISYTASFNGVPFETNSSRTDKEGKRTLEIKLPATIELGLTIVEVSVEHQGITGINSILIPTSKSPVWIDFAPEGGLFVDGFESQMGFRTYDYLGNPVEIQAEVLTKHNELVTNIKSTGKGFGSFRVKADAQNPLFVRITEPSGIDIDFQLPPVQENGIRLSLESRENDELNFSVNTDIDDGAIPLHAVGEINGNLIFQKRFNLKMKNEFSVPVEAAELPGVLRLTLLSRTGEALAHRSVYLRGKQPVIIHDNSTQPADRRQKQINALITSPKGLTYKANLSVSVTDQNLSPDWKPAQDIMSWFLLGPNSSYAAFPSGFLANPSAEDEKIIDHYMLFLLDNIIDWEAVKTNKINSSVKTREDFRDELEQFVKQGDFEILISEIRKNQFFSLYYFDDNKSFPEFIDQNNQALENMGFLPVKISGQEQIQKQLASGQSIMSVIMSVKPYKMMGNKIVFRGADSFNYQDGALIVIDGVPRGTDPGVFNSISPLDVESLKVSTNISDIQKYSGLNTVGIIELTTKKGEVKPAAGQPAGSKYPTLFWESNLSTGEDGKISILLPESPVKSKAQTCIQGIAENGSFLIWLKK